MIKLSRSKIELFLDCPRCFWLDVKKNVKRPAMFPYTINNAIDFLLKREFDAYREKVTPHPIMAKNNIDAVPYRSPHMDQWRSNFNGVRHEHEKTGFLVYGAVDDVWVNPKGELIVVDYKATGANQHQVQDSYRRQMEIYQWLLRRNNFNVSPTGYFVFARANKTNGFAASAERSPAGEVRAILPFDLFVEHHQGDDSWIERALANARQALDSDEIPSASPECGYCQYRNASSQFTF